MLRRNRKGKRFLVGSLEVAANKLLKVLRVRNATVGVFLLSGKEIESLKSRFLKNKKKKGPTDVLAFPEPRNFPHPEGRKRYLGDIYLNKDLQSGDNRFSFLLIHGLLHILGFSHKRRRDILKMESLEKKLLDKLFKQEKKIF